MNLLDSLFQCDLHLQKRECAVSNFFEFAKEILTSSSTNSVKASLNVTSLFTNILLDEMISICLELLHNNRDDRPPSPGRSKELRWKLFLI